MKVTDTIFQAVSLDQQSYASFACGRYEESEIYDITGRRVFPQQTAPGIYSIVINGETAGTITQVT
jgi:hypothetical protein